ncbi:hypothetical protein PM082_024882 [Marasmius tenuissimus]|nr:hypothetical protein PM082_024882 [Marasmius tenuissimus]
MFIRLWIWLFISLFGFAITQQFSPSPSQWRKPTMTFSRKERIGRASNALITTLQILNSTSGQFTGSSYWGNTGWLYLNMVEFDRATNGTQYMEVLLSYFPIVEATRPSFLDQ